MGKKKRILVTGASGFLGWNLCEVAAQNYEVFGTYFKHAVSIEKCNLTRIDLTDQSQTASFIDRIKPHIIIHTAALSQPNYCQEHPEESERVNVSVPAELASWCSRREIKFVFTSSDLVFDGTDAPYDENAPVSPLSLYGEQKAGAEKKILATNPYASACRMPLMYGCASPDSESFIQPLVRSLRQKQTLFLFTDEFRTPVSARDAARGLLIASQTQGGILHLGGPERLSRYEMGLRIAESIGCDPALIKPIKQEDVPMPAPRPKDVSLQSSKAQSLGWEREWMLASTIDGILCR